MKKIAVCLTFVFLFVGFVQAQRTKTLTGMIVDEISSNKWSAVVIQVGNKKYGVQTEFMASVGDARDGVKSWRLKTTGNVGKGKTAQVFYTKVDNTFDYDGVNTWLKAVKIVEVKNPKSSGKSSSTIPQSNNWAAFWTNFRAAVGKRDRKVLKTMMSQTFQFDTEDMTPDQAFTFLNSNNKKPWTALDAAISGGAAIYSSRNSQNIRRIAPAVAARTGNYDNWRALFTLGKNGRWQWTAFIIGD